MAGGDIVCELLRGEVSAEVVWRDEHVIAFLDHRPVFKGHVLVCPIRHTDTLLDLPTDEIEPLFSAARRIAAALGVALGADGTFVAVNNVISQSVPHLHVHVVPRRRGDGLRGFFWPRTSYAPGELEAHGRLIREALDR
ncbi:MAG: HIT family protein [Micropruina sp.]|nr:HIT family protein [Micropruina sp.]